MPVELLSLGLFAALALADPEIQAPGQEPDMILLEFLGSWETENGEWVDPMMWEHEDTAPPLTEKSDDT